MASKYLEHNGVGGVREVEATVVSTGGSDNGKIPALNADGVLDPTVMNATTVSAGSGDEGKIPQLDGSGRLDPTVMPPGVGAETKSIQASEALAAGDTVNIHDVTGAFRVRKSDATTVGKEVHGFVLSAVSSGANATVYFEGENTQISGLSPGPVFMTTTPGVVSNTPPSGSGNVVQRVGFATSATSFTFEAGQSIVLA